jgi:hypothetical protein
MSKNQRFTGLQMRAREEAAPPSPEAQVEGRVTNTVEMGQESTDAAVAAIKAISEY